MKRVTLKQKYQAQRNRIINFIRRAEKRGFYFDEDILPKIPKRITKQSVRRLEKLDAESLYKKSIWVNLETGEFMSGPRRVEYERSVKAKRAAATRKANREAERILFTSGGDATVEVEDYPDLYEIAYDNVYDEFLKKISVVNPDEYQSFYTKKREKKGKELARASKQGQSEVMTLLNDLLKKYTKSEIGKVISDNYALLESNIEYILYGSDKAIIAASSVMIMQILTGGLTKQQNSRLTEEAEVQEGWDD